MHPENSSDSEPVSPGRAAYNVVSDTVVGVNARKSDNKFQLVFVAISVAVFAILFTLLFLFNPRWGMPWYGGAMVGSFVGLLFGIVASGIYLMIYRASRHLQGKHD